MLRHSFQRFGITIAQVEDKLRAAVSLSPTAVKVVDQSGGCGSFFNITVESPAFEGKTVLQQQRMVNEVLKEEIKELHGFQLSTKVCKK